MFIKLLNTIVLLVFLTQGDILSKVKIKGILLDCNGVVNNYSQVILLNGLLGKPQIIYKPNNQGAFDIDVESSDIVFYIQFSMPFHKTIRIPIINDSEKTLEMIVSLSTLNYFANFENMLVVGDFNNYDVKKGVKFSKHTDGTYLAKIKSNKQRIKYKITNISSDNQPVHGTSSIEYEYDNQRNYFSIASVINGEAKVLFDPSKLLVKDYRTQINIRGNAFDEVIIPEYVLYFDLWNYLFALEIAKFNKSCLLKSFEINYSEYVNSLLEKINREKDNNLSDIYKLLYVGIYEFHSINEYDINLRKEYFTKVSPSSKAWFYVPRAFNYTAMKNRSEEFLSQCKLDFIRFQVLFNRLADALNISDYKNYNRLYDELFNEYGNTTDWLFVKNNFPTKYKIGTGYNVPNFRFGSIAANGVEFSRRNMMGKIYLIDFWQIGCEPCIEEIPFLEKVFEKYKNMGLEILSINVGDNIEKIKKFQKERHPMPWKNGVISIGNPKLKDFGVVGYPTIMLVNEKGIIVEYNRGLRRDLLQQTIAKYFPN